MNDDAKLSRRRFAQVAGATTLAGPTIVSARALGRDGQAAASERITLGFIGMGTMNRYHLTTLLKRPELQVLAVCDCDTNRRENARKTVDEHYNQQASKGREAEHCKGYNNFRDLLQRTDIDAVVIATPDHWHAIQIIEACKAGKDIYCEKPLTLTIHEAKVVIDAVRKYARVLQTGSQQRTEFDGKFRTACEYVRSGRLGRILTVHAGLGGPSHPCHLPAEPMEPGLDWDLWLGPAPQRPYHSILSPRGVHKHFPNWRSYKEYSGGGMTDFGAHHFDIAQWGLGRDDSGPSFIRPPDDEKAERGVHYWYDDGVELIHGGPSGVTFIGTVGMIQVDRDKLISIPAEILKRPLEKKNVRLPRARSHHDDWLECIKTRRDPIAKVEVGARSVTVCHLGNLAYWHRQPLYWDADAWDLSTEAEVAARETPAAAVPPLPTGSAVQSISTDRERRDPWKLPEI
jgi:predicted dehydrogenase